MGEFLRLTICRAEEFWKRHERAVGIMGLGALLTGIGVLAVLVLSRGDSQGIEIIQDEAVVGPDITSGPEAKLSLVVDVAGAVEKPGVYRLDSGARLADALAAAGGLSASADRDWMAKYINLAQRVTDETKIYVPEKGETVEKTPQTPQTPQTGSVIGTTTGAVSINSATTSELDGLWGIGEKRAQSIVEGRPYTRVEELVERKIIPKNVYERNKDKLGL